MEPFSGGNQSEAAAAQRRIMDADVDPAMQHLHSYPPENFYLYYKVYLHSYPPENLKIKSFL